MIFLKTKISGAIITHVTQNLPKSITLREVDASWEVTINVFSMQKPDKRDAVIFYGDFHPVVPNANPIIVVTALQLLKIGQGL